MTTQELLQRILPDQRLLLRAVLGTDEAARAAFAEWRDRVIIEDLPGEAHRLLPLLARRIGDLAPQDPVRDLIRGAYRLAWVKNHLITRDAGAIADALQRERIPVLALKGAALVGYYGNDWGTRPMHDVDLLVPIEQVDRAFHIISGEGWRPEGGISAEWLASRVVPRRHALAFSRGLEEELDLHWHVLAESLGAHADDRFWANRVEIELGGVKVGALRPPDLLLHVLAHGALPASRCNVQWVADTVHLLRASNPAELAEPLVTEARRHGLLTTVRATLETVDALLDEPAVRPLLRQLSSTRAPVLERIAMAGGSERTAPARTAAARLSRRRVGDEGILRRSAALARQWLDFDHVTRRAAYVAYVASGCRPGVAALARRRGATFVRTSQSPVVALGNGVDLDFTSAATGDHHAGPGWSALDDLGLGTHGPEARIVVDLDGSRQGDLELGIVARSYDARPRPVEVRVNERTVARVMLQPVASRSDIRVQLPAAVAWRFRPMEIAFVAASKGMRLGKGGIGIRLASVRITPRRLGRDPEPPAPQPGSPPDGG